MDERSELIERALDVPMLIVALAVIPVLVLEETDVSSGFKTVASVLNWTIWLAFLTELIVMLSVVPNRREWLGRHPLDVAIVVLTPPFLSGLAGVRLLRLLRLVRLMRLAQLSRQVFSLEGLRYAAVLALVTVIGGGLAFEAVERGHNPKHLDAWDGIWWCITSMTTLGSEVQPTTTGGRVIAIAAVIIGLAFVALLTGVVAQRFLSAQVEEVEEVAEELEVAEQDVLAEVREIARRLERLERALQRRRPAMPGN